MRKAVAWVASALLLAAVAVTIYLGSLGLVLLTQDLPSDWTVASQSDVSEQRLTIGNCLPGHEYPSNVEWFHSSRFGGAALLATYRHYLGHGRVLGTYPGSMELESPIESMASYRWQLPALAVDLQTFADSQTGQVHYVTSWNFGPGCHLAVPRASGRTDPAGPANVTQPG